MKSVFMKLFKIRWGGMVSGVFAALAAKGHAEFNTRRNRVGHRSGRAGGQPAVVRSAATVLSPNRSEFSQGLILL